MQLSSVIELHVHTYAVGVADIASCEGSPHNVLHSSSINSAVAYNAVCLQCCSPTFKTECMNNYDYGTAGGNPRGIPFNVYLSFRSEGVCRSTVYTNEDSTMKLDQCQ